MTRQDNLTLLHKLRRKGWEQYILLYGISFNEENASDSQLQQHVRKIMQRRQEIISSRISLAVKVIFVLLVLSLVILNAILKG